MKYGVGYVPRAAFARNIEFLSGGQMPLSLNARYWSLWGLTNLVKFSSYLLGDGTRLFDSVDELVANNHTLYLNNSVTIKEARVLHAEHNMTTSDFIDESRKIEWGSRLTDFKTFTMSLNLGGGRESIQASYSFTVVHLHRVGNCYNNPLIGAKFGDVLAINTAFYREGSLVLHTELGGVTNETHYQRYTQAKERVTRVLL